jgi:hypothetical protein
LLGKKSSNERQRTLVLSADKIASGSLYIMESTKDVMSRDVFIQIMNENLERVKKVFENKNRSYGKGNDAFHNFRATAIRKYGEGSPGKMYDVLFTLMDKHLVALANNGLDDPEFEERTRDVIVYSLIALGIYQEYKGEA